GVQGLEQAARQAQGIVGVVLEDQHVVYQAGSAGGQGGVLSGRLGDEREQAPALPDAPRLHAGNVIVRLLPDAAQHGKSSASYFHARSHGSPRMRGSFVPAPRRPVMPQAPQPGVPKLYQRIRTYTEFSTSRFFLPKTESENRPINS